MTTTSNLIRVQPSPLAHGVADPKDVVGMTGMEFFNAMAQGRFPPPPISKTLNFTLTEFEHGRAIFEGEPLREFYNPLGSIHGSYAAALLDSCMGCAVHTALPAGQAYTTLEYKISLVRGMTDKTGVVRAEGKVL